MGDCYFISVLKSLYQNPKTRGAYYKMFEQKGNDICVTIPAYKGYKGEIRFKDGKIDFSAGSARAAKHVLMLERTYARTALRDDRFTRQVIPFIKNEVIVVDPNFSNFQNGIPIDEFLKNSIWMFYSLYIDKCCFWLSAVFLSNRACFGHLRQQSTTIHKPTTAIAF